MRTHSKRGALLPENVVGWADGNPEPQSDAIFSPEALETSGKVGRRSRAEQFSMSSELAGMVLRCEKTGKLFFNSKDAELHAEEIGSSDFAQASLRTPLYHPSHHPSRQPFPVTIVNSSQAGGAWRAARGDS